MAGAKNGEYSRFLNFHGRNPDVLNSIANLSNDEVFTPPEFANRMLDTLEKAWAESNNGENIWANPDLKFLDPFTKSGVFLREITTRLIKGLEPKIPDLQSRVDHILTKQVFGIATTHLTSLMARRSLYCSKKANGKHSITKKFKDESGNIWFEPITHTWIGGTIREITMDEAGNEVERYVDGKCKYCSASKRDFDREKGLELHAYGLIHNDDPKKWVGEKFGIEMQFDVIIGNPPYQLDDGGYGTSAAPIYNMFVNQAKKLEPRFLVMVVPARWFSGGKGLEKFRAEMLGDRQIRKISDYPDSSSVFPGVQIKGGVCVFLWERGNPGLVEVESNSNSSEINIAQRELLEPGLDVFIRFNQAVPILKKIASVEGDDKPGSHSLSLGSKSFKNLVSSSKPFGLRTFVKAPADKFPGALLVHQNGGKGYVARSEISSGLDLIDEWKVFIPRAGSGSDSFPHTILGVPFVGKPGEISTETYNCIGPFATEAEAINVAKYIATKLFRFLVLLHKPSQDASQAVYEFVPILDFTRPWSESDLVDRWGLDGKELEFISSLVRPMELNNGG
jgi:site-specific DNA-methyltransferase (adenine-specific)